MNKKNTLALVLAGTMLLPANAFAANRSDFSDLPNDWSTEPLIRAIDNGLLSGSNGKINGKGLLTRAQLAAIVNRAFGAVKSASLTNFNDVLPSEWYYNDIAKSVQMGILQGSNGMMNPNDPVTREEAFTVLARAFALTDDSSAALEQFTDNGSVSPWAADSIAALVEGGYVNGANGRLTPKANITRAEFAKLITGMTDTFIGEEGASNRTVEGNLIVRASGALLSGVTVNGDLVIADGADGVMLSNVTVTGRIVIRGGAGGVTASGTTAAKGTIVSNPSDTVLIHAVDGKLGAVTAYTDLTVDGKLDSVTAASKVAVSV